MSKSNAAKQKPPKTCLLCLICLGFLSLVILNTVELIRQSKYYSDIINKFQHVWKFLKSYYPNSYAKFYFSWMPCCMSKIQHDQRVNSRETAVENTLKYNWLNIIEKCRQQSRFIDTKCSNVSLLVTCNSITPKVSLRILYKVDCVSTSLMNDHQKKTFGVFISLISIETQKSVEKQSCNLICYITTKMKGT